MGTDAVTCYYTAVVLHYIYLSTNWHAAIICFLLTEIYYIICFLLTEIYCCCVVGSIVCSDEQACVHAGSTFSADDVTN